MRLTSGSILAGRYRLAQPLGEGGMGQVWAATHLVTRRQVAVKRLILPHDEEALGQAQARFALEARSACAVDHPNVVEVFDFVQEPNEAPFIVMQLLQGETLADKLAREQSLTTEAAAALLLPVVSAVGTAHARGIIHRDLKPSNIFLCAERGKSLVKVLDFGIAKWMIPESDEASLKTQTGSTLGTPSYMAPEQATGERSIDHRADIWSLGVILYECLSGVRPVEGENPAQMVMRLLSSGIIPIQHLVPGLPPALSLLIGRMLARDRRKRPEDLEEVFVALKALTHADAPSFGKPPSALFGAEAEPAPVLAAASVTPEPVGAWAPPTHPVLGSAPPPASARSEQPRARSGRPGVVLGVFALGLVLWFGRTLVLPSRGLEPSRAGAQLPAAVSAVKAESGAVPRAPEAALLAPAGLPAAEPAAPAGVPTVAAGSAGAMASSKPAPARSKPKLGSKKRAASAALTSAAARLSGSNAGAAAKSPPAPSASGLGPRGAACDRSQDCESRLCVAFSCE